MMLSKQTGRRALWSPFIPLILSTVTAATRGLSIFHTARAVFAISL